MLLMPGTFPDLITLEDAVSAGAACRDIPEEDKQCFYPVFSSPAETERQVSTATSYCRRCPVEGACLQLALVTAAGRHGVWGGTTEDERATLRRSLMDRERRAAA